MNGLVEKLIKASLDFFEFLNSMSIFFIDDISYFSDGWAYLNIDGTRSGNPSNTRIGQSRRRRLIRRTVKLVH